MRGKETCSSSTGAATQTGSNRGARRRDKGVTTPCERPDAGRQRCRDFERCARHKLQCEAWRIYEGRGNKQWSVTEKDMIAALPLRGQWR